MSESQMPQDGKKHTLDYVVRGLLAVVIILFGMLAVKPLILSADIIGNYPYQLDREEGFLLNQAIQLSKGESIYHSLDSYPYTVGNYTPLYPAVYAFFLLFAEPGLGIGRALVLISTIIIIVVMAGYVYSETKSVLAALLPPVLFLTTYALNDWIRYARVDIPAIALGLAGFWAATRERWRIYTPLAIILFTLAFFTKQTQIIAPLSVLIALVLRGEIARAVFLVLPLVFLVTLFVGLLVFLTDGHFWLHTVTYNQNVFHWDQVQVWVSHLFRFSLWTMSAGIVALLLGLVSWMMWSKKVEIEIAGSENEAGEIEIEEKSINAAAPLSLVTYLFLATLSILTIGKDGAAVNYLLEFQAVLALYIATQIGRFLQPTSATNLPVLLRNAFAVFLMIPLCFQVWFLHMKNWGDYTVKKVVFREAPNEIITLAGDDVVYVLENLSGDVLSEFPIFNILAGKDVLFQPYIMSTLAREGKWDSTQLIADLVGRRFSVIVTEKNLAQEEFTPGFTRTMQAAILESYELFDVLPAGPNGAPVFIYRAVPGEGDQIAPLA